VRILNNLIIHLLLWWNRGKQPQFKKWIFLEQQKEKIVQAVENDDNFPSELLSYISTAWGIDRKWFENADWTLLVNTFYVCISKSPQVELPITTPSGDKQKDDPWDYENRTWHLYSHMLAKSYGWNLEYIARLSVMEALAKVQEIIAEDQLDKEFYYGLSEVAYHYDKGTKQSKFVPLPRPHWMRPKILPIKKSIMPASLLPVGVVITEGVLPPEFMPKEIH
jgi:hypothetical protein